jgi:ribosomal protein L14
MKRGVGVRGRGFTRGWAIGTVAAACCIAGAAQALDRLSATGARLAPEVVADPRKAVVVRTVDLQGDVPSATYVMAHDLTNRMLQRTNDGYWIAWDRKLTSLVDNQITPQNGKLVFKVFAEDISAAQFPLSITLAYKVGDVVKYGVFPVQVAP